MPVEPKVTVAELQVVGLFSAIDEGLIAELADQLHVISLSAGQIVFREGDAGRTMYVVLEGQLELTKRSRRGRETRIVMLDSGDWFGEMSLLGVMARPTTACATQATRLLEIRALDLDRLYRSNVKAYALMVMNIARQLSRKLSVAESILADTVTSVIDHYADNGES
jgi:CRP/FNR family cyclic AMP-dependent transcriptional regulator